MSTTLDLEIHALCSAGRFDAAAGRLVEHHGGEIMRFMVSRTANAQWASEAFAVFSEDVCRGLPDFAFRCTTRTWLYALAHHAVARVRRVVRRERVRMLPLSDLDLRSPLAMRERTATPEYLRSEPKRRLLSLRKNLSRSDQELLDLRIVRCFSWKDIARILSPACWPPEAPAANVAVVDKEAARLRKRYQLVIERLRAMAQQQGLLPDEPRG